MKIPKRIKKHNRKFIFVKRYPNFVMYEDFLAGYKECFSFHELGLITEQIEPPKVYINAENVKL